jgi:lysozyme
MIPSNNAIQFIKDQEGTVLHSYQDSAGIWTIGIGSTMYRDGTPVRQGESVTIVQALDLLKWEVDRKANIVDNLLHGVKLNQNQYDALVSFTYNVGIGALANSTLLKKIKIDPADESIRNEFMKWNKIHLHGRLVENAGLTARRQREADLYFKIDNYG